MTGTKLSSKLTIVTLLSAVFVAIEGYFLNSILVSLIPQFWFSSVVLYVLSIVLAYFLKDVIVQHVYNSKRKKIVVGAIIILLTIIMAVALSIAVLYLNKLQLQSTFH